jgi:superfamily II DNA helicase RecQ
VLLTGREKSLLFIVPGLIEEGGITIIIVPYCVLITDLISRIRKSGIEYIE